MTRVPGLSTIAAFGLSCGGPPMLRYLLLLLLVGLAGCLSWPSSFGDECVVAGVRLCR